MFEKSHFEVLEWFSLNFPDLVREMRDSHHNFSDEDVNPYHAENCVWSHTMLVFKNSDFFSPENHAVKWSSLLHDVGKPGARESVTDKKKTRFIGHEGLSAFMAIDVMNKAGFTPVQAELVFKLVAGHSELFDFLRSGGINEKKIMDRFVYNASLLEDLVEQVRADSLGRFHSGDTREQMEQVKKLPELFQPIYEKMVGIVQLDDKEDHPRLTLLVGPPCSGKSSYLSSLMQKIEDQAIMDVAENFLK